jgi:hypothetical protein
LQESTRDDQTAPRQKLLIFFKALGHKNLLEMSENQSSSSSLPLFHPSSYASAISPSELLNASRSSRPIDLPTIFWRLLILKATEVSVDSEVRTGTDFNDRLEEVSEYMWGKLSSSENDKGVQVLSQRQSG